MKETIRKFMEHGEMPSEMAVALSQCIKNKMAEAGHGIKMYFYCQQDSNEWMIGTVKKESLSVINEYSPFEWEYSHFARGFHFFKLKENGAQIVLCEGSYSHIYTWDGCQFIMTAAQDDDGEYTCCAFPSPPDDYQGYVSYEECGCAYCVEMKPGDVIGYEFQKATT